MLREIFYTSQTDIFPTETTTFYTPPWYSEKTREKRPLPMIPSDYKVTRGAPCERWTVTSLKMVEVVYCGIGPVEILRGGQVKG
ncbi:MULTISPECIES: hypothetical protein [Variovorax]|uniref:hypothetical protein n=1 Tax=Variovorax TaxID=34072 RepID=UPI000B26A674|nr:MULTISPECIES: hypothetical protein [Variovorax]UKI10793.1 hypothetical protein L3V85_13380 [Variovorax paradoxus]